MEEYQNKVKEYSSYLVAREHNPKTLKSTFDKIEEVLSSVVRKKKYVVFSPEFNPPDPNISEIINKHRH